MRVAGRAPVYAGASAVATQDAVHLARQASNTGADAVTILCRNSSARRPRDEAGIRAVRLAALAPAAGPAAPARLLSGEITVKLPSLAEFAAETHLAVGTIRRAVDVLAREHLVQKVPGRGTFVTAPGDRRAAR